MTKTIAKTRFSKVAATPLPVSLPSLPATLDEVRMSVDRFCLLAGIETMNEMLAEDAEALCGPRHVRSPARRGYRWGTTRSELAYHGGKVKIARPRVRDLAGRELRLASWEALSDPDLIKAWALNLMVLTVSTRKYRRAVRLPEGDVPQMSGDGTSKSAVSRRFVALSRKCISAPREHARSRAPGPCDELRKLRCFAS